MATIQTPNGTYLLLQRFSMSTGDHSRYAIAISAENGTTLVSAYTLMLKWIIAQFWALIVLCGVAFFIGRKLSHNRTAATVGIWNAHSPTNVATLTARYVFHLKNEVWYHVVWASLAVIVASSIVGPILLSKYLVIGNAAPVNPVSIYVPDLLHKSPNQVFEDALLDSPAAFRAVSTASPTESVFVTQYIQDGNLNILYGYNRILFYRGRMVQYIGNTPQGQDGYNPFGVPVADPSKIWFAGPLDQGPPFAYLYQADSNEGGGYKLSWAMIVSSAGRPSVTSSTDPWYQTQESTQHPIPNLNSSFAFQTEDQHYHAGRQPYGPTRVARPLLQTLPLSRD